MTTKNNALKLENFSKSYLKKDIISNASFEVPEGSFCGFVGPNGAGKTTTIKSIIDAYSNLRFKGKISIFGYDHYSKEAKKLIGYIPEKASFPIGINTTKYLRSLAYLSGYSFREAKKATDEVLKIMGIENLAKLRPWKFSSGEQKKVLLAQAIIHKPKILIMDEPCANLDPIARASFFEHLVLLNKQGTTIFISSHILSELEQYISDVVMMDKGQIIYSGSLANIKKDSQTKAGNLIYEVVFDTEVPKSLITFIEKNKIIFNVSKNHLLLDLENRERLNEVTGFLLRENINYLSISQVNISLQDILLNKIKRGKSD